MAVVQEKDVRSWPKHDVHLPYCHRPRCHCISARITAGVEDSHSLRGGEGMEEFAAAAATRGCDSLHLSALENGELQQDVEFSYTIQGSPTVS